MKTLKIGDRGKEVERLQTILNEFGYNLKIDGDFGVETQKIVKDFQEKHNLISDGIVGYNTWEVLFFYNRKAGKKITDEDFRLASELIDVEFAALKAVSEVETNGKGGFLPSGKPVILFEGHIFWEQLKKKGINPEEYADGNRDILYPKWTKGNYKGGEEEYSRLDRARKIDKEAADASASWGMFQVMGFNYEMCGEKNVEDFVEMMSESELHQLLLSIRFIRNSGMLKFLQNKDWDMFAKRYNGPSYAENRYDTKLEAAYRKYS